MKELLKMNEMTHSYLTFTHINETSIINDDDSNDDDDDWTGLFGNWQLLEMMTVPKSTFLHRGKSSSQLMIISHHHQSYH
jgi:hypothetical protein